MGDEICEQPKSKQKNFEMNVEGLSAEEICLVERLGIREVQRKVTLLSRRYGSSLEFSAGVARYLWEKIVKKLRLCLEYLSIILMYHKNAP